MQDAIAHLQRMIASRGADAEAGAWAAAGLSAWLNAGGGISLPRCLGFQTSATRVQTALRNRWLIEAAEHVPGETQWAKCVALQAEIEHFENRRWPSWRRDNLPPARATAVEQCLFFGRRHGEFPRTARMLRNILGE